MDTHEIFLVAADGTISPSEWKSEPHLERESQLPAIVKKLSDPRFSAAELQRLIFDEMVLVVGEMGKHGRRPDEAPIVRHCTQLLKALDRLGKQVQIADATRKCDVLDLDGPRFVFVLGELIDLFKEAAQAALGNNNDTLVQSIMKHWRDLLAANEARIRSEVKRICNGKDEMAPQGPSRMTFNS